MSAMTELAAGIVILEEWLGSGGVPVKRELAEKRSKVCESCPLNSHGKWWERSKSLVANSIKIYLKVKHRLDIRVDNEERLFMCSACGCAARLKVHVPLVHIKEHTTQEVIDKLDSNCWIRKEKTK